MNATLTFQLPEEQEEFDTVLKAQPMSTALFEISQELFRPARKHGYMDHRIQELMVHLDALANKNAGIPEDAWEHSPGATDLIGMLEAEFYRILEENGITL